ncbi:MAG: HNH endonuclease [Chloroflexi bacterium]|nr:HNH endonuclease [Chloroflexota bacterium]
MSDRATAERKRIVQERANGCCEYCKSQARFETYSFAIEHIVPKSRGGTTSLENLAFSCQGCNNAKFTKVQAFDPLTKTLVPLFHPRQNKWREHFEWNADFTLIVGLTPIGRATVLALQLNRIGLINLRRILHLTGNHPPVERD